MGNPDPNENDPKPESDKTPNRTFELSIVGKGKYVRHKTRKNERILGVSRRGISNIHHIVRYFRSSSTVDLEQHSRTIHHRMYFGRSDMASSQQSPENDRKQAQFDFRDHDPRADLPCCCTSCDNPCVSYCPSTEPTGRLQPEYGLALGSISAASPGQQPHRTSTGPQTRISRPQIAGNPVLFHVMGHERRLCRGFIASQCPGSLRHRIDELVLSLSHRRQDGRPRAASGSAPG